MENTIIVVNDEPYCIWDEEIKQKNLEFISGIDENYFKYCLDTHHKAEDTKRASIALRLAFYHGLETLFSLIGAYVQAPDCVYAWLAKCSNSDLRSLVKKIDQGDRTLFTKLKIKKISWDSIAENIFLTYLPGTEKNKIMTKHYAKVWRRLARELTDEEQVCEYNSLKHGFRVRAGGFCFSIGEEESGMAPATMECLTYSDFGTSFYKFEAIGPKKENRNLLPKSIALNWSLERTSYMLQMIKMSIANLKSAIKIINGDRADENIFVRPLVDEDFFKPWTYSPKYAHSAKMIIDDNLVGYISKKELWKIINDQKK